MKWIVAPVFIALAAGAVASTGCGGGGGGGGGSSSTGGGGSNTKNSYSGTVSDGSGDLLAGDTVSFDGSTTYKATTNTSGAFDITGVPTTALTGSDYLIVTDASGTEIAEYSLAGDTGSVSGIVITTGPPAPPTSLTVKK